MGIIVRSKKGRMGLETDNRANWGCRVYRFISLETKEAFKELVAQRQSKTNDFLFLSRYFCYIICHF